MGFFQIGRNGGTACDYLLKKSTDWLKVALTWGTTGGEDECDRGSVFIFANSGSSWDVIGTETITWDVNGLVTATTWS